MDIRQMIRVGWRRPAGSVLGLTVFCLLTLPLRAEGESAEDMQPPIGVFGEAVHDSGEIKFSYRLQVENRAGLMEGRDRIQPGPVEAAYPGGSIPVSFRSYAHVMELTWKPSDAITLFVTLPFYERTLDQYVESTGVRYRRSVRGFGDAVLNSLYRVFGNEHHRVHLNLGQGAATAWGCNLSEAYVTFNSAYTT